MSTFAPLSAAVSKNFPIEIASGFYVKGDQIAAKPTVILSLIAYNLKFFGIHMYVGAVCKRSVGFVRNSDYVAWLARPHSGRHHTHIDTERTEGCGEGHDMQGSFERNVVWPDASAMQLPSCKIRHHCKLCSTIPYALSRSLTYPQQRLLPTGYYRVLHFLESIDLRIPCCYIAPFFSSPPCCPQMLSFAGAALGCPFTSLSSTSEGEKCLFSRTLEPMLQSIRMHDFPMES